MLDVLSPEHIAAITFRPWDISVTGYFGPGSFQFMEVSATGHLAPLTFWIISGSGYNGPMSFKSWVILTSANFATWAFQPRIIRSNQFLLPGHFGPMTFEFLVISAQELSCPVSCHIRVILPPGQFWSLVLLVPGQFGQSHSSPWCLRPRKSLFLAPAEFRSKDISIP